MSNVGKRGKVSLRVRLRDALLKGTNSTIRHNEIKGVIDALSKPEAREGEAVAWFGDKDFEPTEAMIDAGMEHCRPGNHANIIASFKAMMSQAEIDGLVSYTHPAAPSADKLRIAVEALDEARENLIQCGDHFGAGQCADAVSLISTPDALKGDAK